MCAYLVQNSWQQQLETHYKQSLKSGETISKALGIVLRNPEQYKVVLQLSVHHRLLPMFQVVLYITVCVFVNHYSGSP